MLLAYVGAAFLAKPALASVLKGAFVPTIHFDMHSLSMLVAIVGTTLSAYLYSWQSNQEVEEDINLGRRRHTDRMGTTQKELRHSAKDIGAGMVFASLITYFIMLSTAATLFKAGKTDINTAAQAAQALVPIAGKLAGVLFTVGVVSVGFIAVPIMITGAAYDLCQSLGWKHGLHYRPAEVKGFNGTIAVCTAIATCLNFLGINPMKALVWSSVVQGLSTPLLMLLNHDDYDQPQDHGMMGEHSSNKSPRWITTAAIFAASIGFLVTWLITASH